MPSTATRRAAALLLLLVPLGFLVCFSLLQQLFEYPAILRQPTPDVLARFAAGGAPLVTVWYALTLTAVAFLPLSVLVHRVLAQQRTSILLWLATAFGLFAAISQTLGFLRWPFLVPFLAEAYLSPVASEAQRTSALMLFDAFHRYAGIAVGEHVGYLSTSLWTLLVAVVMLQTRQFPRWMGALGVVLAVGIAFGLSEPAGFALGSVINAFSYIAWAVWLMLFGVGLLVGGRQRAGVEPQAATVLAHSTLG